MKRVPIYLAIVYTLLSSSNNLTAQNQPYFRIGDTIRGRDSIYHYQWWSENYLSDETTRLFLVNFMYDTATTNTGWPKYTSSTATKEVIVRYCYTEQPLKIVGIATAAYFGRPSDYYDYPVELPSSMPVRTEYLEIFDADTGRNSFPRVAQIEYNYEQQPRYMQIDLRFMYSYFYDCCDTPMTDQNRTIEIREFYLEKPITVRDSFYVGHTTNNNHYAYVCLDEQEGFEDPSFSLYAFLDRYLGWEPKSLYVHGYTGCPDISCTITPLNRYKYRKFYSTDMYTCDTADAEWHWIESNYFMLDFPIIEIDSSFYDGPPQYECPAVQNFHIGTLDNNRVVLLWNQHNEHTGWELSYGPQGAAPDSGNLITAYIPAIAIQGLDSGQHYSVYIRAICMHDSLHYSEWSEPLDFCTCDTSSISIEMPLTERLTHILPNPAIDQVQVISSYGITQVDVYNLQGIRMVSKKTKGLGTTIDVSGWPAGIYIVIIHTPAGNVTKRLVVGH